MDNIQAMIKVDEQLAAKLQAEEQEKYSIEEMLRMLVEMIAKRKRFFAAQRAADQRSKPPTKAQIRNRMCTYLRNMDSKKAKADTEQESNTKRAGDELEQEKAKKQKIDDDQEEAKLKKHMEIVKDDKVTIDAIQLATKPPMIVEYKIVREGIIRHYQ
ncbi:hypothetical protein Tco_1121112 [Tanacetum coccineum]|uniref:Topoisomerase I n=1 Tax=Tanacetum coccineum TaxID=301880 RepID=A0ABQ5IYZ5_9ASTR